VDVDHTFYSCLVQLILVHALNQVVDLVLSVSSITSLDEVGGNFLESSSGRRELEGPQELVNLFEVRSNSVDFVDDILNADHVEFA